MAAEQSWRFAAVADSAPLARQAIREFANRHQIAAAAFADIAICVTEAVANVVVHAYPPGEKPGSIEMLAELADGRLSIAVRDDGGGLRPRIDSPGLGLGLPLIARLSDSSDIRSTQGSGTEVTMTFDLG